MDLIIAGAGPAGLSLALHLLHGARFLVAGTAASFYAAERMTGDE